MFLADCHTHTKYSFDGPRTSEGEVDALCRVAIERGLSELAITDHFEMNGEVEGIYDKTDTDGIRRDVLAAKEKYKDKLYVAYGIELGQAGEYPEYARSVLPELGYEYIIGSLHNLPGVPDFSFFDYGKMTIQHIEKLFRESLVALLDLCDFEEISTIGHFTYMHRYVRRAGKEFDFSKFDDEIHTFLKKVIEKGKALEVNTSTLRDPSHITMPTHELIKLYRQLGGEMMTCGSDSHGAEFVGAGIKETYEFLASAGFKYITVFHDGKPVMKKIG
ncbi:MAG: histidinol-phosphatase HisJ family protein [Clostridia bacterium]|nr:histidinol-phosphatase HisJ family protein [Clostridia bacterium]